MAIAVGTIVEGKVTGITRYGAFVTLPDGSVGMVHISEVSYQYVSDIRDHIQIGQTVRVVVTGDEGGKIKLSIKLAAPPPQKTRPAAPYPKKVTRPNQEDMSFEDKLKFFMRDSDSRISDLKHQQDKKHGGSRRGKH